MTATPAPNRDLGSANGLRLGQGERLGEGEQDADAADRGYRDTECDAEQRTGLGSDPEGVDSGFSDAATESGDAASG